MVDQTGLMKDGLWVGNLDVLKVDQWDEYLAVLTVDYSAALMVHLMVSMKADS